MSAPTKTVFLHVGAPRTGTTFIQDALWNNRELLAGHDLCYPLADPAEHFAVTMDVRDMEWGGRRDPSWDGAWSRVAARILAAPQSRAVVSDELLGGASTEQVRRMVAVLGDADVHVLFTARDLARQLPSDWQQQVKHTHAVPYARFVDDLVTLGPAPPAPFGEMFWGLQDPVGVLRGWATVVGADHVHVVTLPPPTAALDVLWQRVASVLGVGAAGVSLERVDLRRSLGVVETEVLRRLNDRGRLAERLTWMYDGLVRLELTEWILARRPAQRRIAFPEKHRQWAQERSTQLIDGLRAAGYRVTGDLDELMPQDQAGRLPESISDNELLAATLETVSDLLLRLGTVQNPPG